MPNETNQNVDPIDAIAGGFRQSQILFTACRMGVFEVIGHDSFSLDALSQQLHVNQRGLRILCDALAAIGLLEKENGQFRNSALALEFLLSDSPKSKVAILRHNAVLYEKWAKLMDAVTHGECVSSDVIDPRLLESERDFANAMADVARLSAVQTADCIDLSSCTRMLDIGCGPGYFSIEFVRRNPGMTAVLLDHENTLEVARENALKAGVVERIEFLPGDLHRDDLGQGYDFIFISNVVHMFNDEQNASLIRRCADALVSQGRIGLKDFFLEPDRIQPVFSALFAVNMLVGTETGDCFTVEQVQQWFKSSHLEYERMIDITSQSKLIIGKKA
jgi:2-polyprenyl-3-methyl-5-hydroxy-6-metoxy-1,4-benzoquinol methylase